MTRFTCDIPDEEDSVKAILVLYGTVFWHMDNMQKVSEVRRVFKIREICVRYNRVGRELLRDPLSWPSTLDIVSSVQIRFAWLLAESMHRPSDSAPHPLESAESRRHTLFCPVDVRS
jgi:hypothetical protein